MKCGLCGKNYLGYGRELFVDGKMVNVCPACAKKLLAEEKKKKYG